MKIGGMLCTAQYYKQPPSNTYKIIYPFSCPTNFLSQGTFRHSFLAVLQTPRVTKATFLCSETPVGVVSVQITPTLFPVSLGILYWH